MVYYEFSHPDDLEATLRDAPVAYVPLGTYEHHGWHLPVGFDGIKAHALCRRAAEQTGGVVFPTFFYGTGGGHVSYQWTAILEEPLIRPLLAATLDRLARFGFRVVVLLTGHYPPEQVRPPLRSCPLPGRGSGRASSGNTVHRPHRGGDHDGPPRRRLPGRSRGQV